MKRGTLLQTDIYGNLAESSTLFFFTLSGLGYVNLGLIGDCDAMNKSFGVDDKDGEIESLPKFSESSCSLSSCLRRRRSAPRFPLVVASRFLLQFSDILFPSGVRQGELRSS
ncbi:unnamed protein product [Pseudo-nitzschia multistriata]|uniref:Uncharacterized protein n=1 Tax=Pseudo-nitzschia multistriata TaxID=183589 RepID=A0A448ZEW0_9STRA|nr:unnamed protein product [Pseudo-nitzschia multistriata]